MTLFLAPVTPAVPGAELVTSNAVSQSAATLRRELEEATESAHSAQIQRQADLLLAVIEACAVAQQEGWDGYRGRSVTPGVYIVAASFVRALPPAVTPPEVSVHPDGEIAFDWLVDRHRQFSVSVDANGVLSYAGLFGKNKVTGKEKFSRTIPTSLIQHIIRLSDRDGTAVIRS